MATLDDKILDGPNVGYCSDSDDEGRGDIGFRSSTPLSAGSSRPSQGDGSTGPKGVLADYRRHERQQRIDRANTEKELIKEAKRFTLEEAGNHSNCDDEVNKDEDNDDELASIRRRRLEQLKSFSRGRITEINSTETFLQVTDIGTSELVLIHIYRDGLYSVGVLNDALLEVAARVEPEDAKFYKVKASILGTSLNFAENALPALQVYEKGNLIGNFVRITDEFDDDFTGQQLCKFLDKHDIYFGRS